MSSKTAAQLREVYGRRIDGTVGLLHRDVLIDASDLSALLDMAEEAEDRPYDREHIVEIYPRDMEQLRTWIARPNGGYVPSTSPRLTLEAVEHGGIRIHIQPFEKAKTTTKAVEGG